MLPITEIVPIYHKAGKIGDHRSEFLWRRLEALDGDQGSWLKSFYEDGAEQGQ
jgi:hypothetical protein